MNAQRKKSPLIGLTGGMGCGKSTVGKLLVKEGWSRGDTDEWVRSRILFEREVVEAARTLFGAAAIRADGSIDRSHVGHLVFSDPALLERWESVIHPRVRAYTSSWAKENQDQPRVVEIPLLFEKGLEKGFDFIVCVASSSETQYVRLMERGVSRALAEQRITKQLPLALKIQSSHFVIWNDGSLGFLSEQVAHLSRHLLGRA
ncbi:MAG: dephospho-CoA kinase [Opitutaceae bacterium]|nr:dephospho-CoA kinase [Opitutaceae bacterium]